MVVLKISLLARVSHYQKVNPVIDTFVSGENGQF